MIISSEITGKTYKTVDECLAAEKAFIEKKEAEEKAAKELEAKKDEAYKKAIGFVDNKKAINIQSFPKTIQKKALKLFYHNLSPPERLMLLNKNFPY